MDNKILELSKKLMSIPSIKGETKEINRILELAKKELSGYAYKEYENNGISSLLFYNTKTLPKKFKLILDVHLDVVPGNPEQYKPKVLGDKLYGRGAYDMKAAGAAEILLYKELANRVNYPLGLQLVTDEETGGFNAAKHQASKGVDAECMVVGECSSDLTVSVTSKGAIWMKITFTGTPSHSAYLWEGKNPVLEMNKFLTKLWKLYPIPKEKVWKTTINVAIVGTTNVTGNKVPGDASVQLDIRYIPGDGEKTLKKIKSLLPKTVKIEVLVNEPGTNTPENNRYVRGFISCAQSILKSKILVVGKNGATDLRHFPNSAGIEFGPVGGGPHTDNEWVSIKSLSVFYDILKSFLLSLNK